MKRTHRFLYRLLLAVVSPIAFIGILEIGFQMTGWGYPTRFLIRWEMNGEQVWIDNQLFGYRFFAPAVSRSPTPLVIPVEKQTNELRVVVLGESAAMGEPEPAYGPARMLEKMLQHRYPEKKVRVINAAMTAINSHVITEIARDLPRMKPDVVILYIGNNEVVGPLGPGTVFNSFFAAPRLNEQRVKLSRLRIVSALRSWAFRMTGSDETRWMGMEMFLDHLVEENDPRMNAVYASFRRNMETIVKRTVQAGALPIVCTVAVNLADQAPLDGGAFPESATKNELVQLRNADALRFRSDQRINEIARDVAGENGHVLLVDLEALFSTDHAPGYRFFIDHVHFNLDGSYKVAASWESAITNRLPSSTPTVLRESEVKNRLVWNPYNAIEISEVMLERSSRPPFSGTADHAKRMIYWTREHARNYAEARQLSLDTVIQDYQSAIQLDPTDLYLPQQAVRALLLENRFEASAHYFESLFRMIPHRSDVRGWKVMLHALNGEADQAWKIMMDHAPPYGELPADVLISASEMLFHANYKKESVSLLTTAAEHYPHRMRLQSVLTSRLAHTGQRAEALKRMASLVKQHPGNESLREEYGILLSLMGRISEAEPYFDHVRDAQDPSSRLKWIQYLLALRKNTEAENQLNLLVQESDAPDEAFQILIQFALSRGDVQAAHAWAEQRTTRQPWNGEAWGQRGDLSDTLNKPSEAVACYEKAIPLLTAPASAQRALAWLLATEDDPTVRNPEKARHLMEALYPNELDDPGYTGLVRGAVWASLERWPEAISEIDAALAATRKSNDQALLEQLQRARILFMQHESIRRARQ